MKNNALVKNRFTGKIYEKHNNITPNGLMNIQDSYLFMPWIAVIAEGVDEDMNMKMHATKENSNMTIKAKFIGSKHPKHSMGFKHGEVYELKTKVKKDMLFVFAANDILYCPYDSMEAFLKNWDIYSTDEYNAGSLPISNSSILDKLPKKDKRLELIEEIKEQIRYIKFIKNAELYAEDDEHIADLLEQLKNI